MGYSCKNGKFNLIKPNFHLSLWHSEELVQMEKM
jgi:hypothetical protein